MFFDFETEVSATEQIHADTNDDLHDGHVGRTQCRVRLHLWHTGVSTYSRIRGPGYIIVLRAQRGAQPTCNANTQRGTLSSEPLVGISPLQEYDWEAVSQTAYEPVDSWKKIDCLMWWIVREKFIQFVNT